MLDKTLAAKITEFVRQQPRTIQEIAQLIDKNWRTAERYCNQIATETGLIAGRTFRGGTRGALRIVYWNAIEPGRGSAYQERLLQQILRGRKKEDFSPFDLYQFVPPARREAFVEKNEFSNEERLMYDKIMLGANHQLLSFSGNLSWLGLRLEMLKALETLAKRKISIKVLTRIDHTSQENVERALAINRRVGWDAVEIRHCEQPVRAVIVDDTLAVLKQVMTPSLVREVKEKKFVFYRVEDAEWVTWLQKVFWHLWGESVEASVRLEALATMQEL